MRFRLITVNKSTTYDVISFSSRPRPFAVSRSSKFPHNLIKAHLYQFTDSDQSRFGEKASTANTLPARRRASSYVLSLAINVWSVVVVNFERHVM